MIGTWLLAVLVVVGAIIVTTGILVIAHAPVVSNKVLNDCD